MTTLAFSANSDGIHLNGKKISIKGVNIYGLETETFSVHGLWAVSLDDILDFVKINGFNAVRVPFSLEAALGLDAIPTGSINTSVNPGLVGKTVGQMFDALVDGCFKRNLLVMPDMHRFKSTDAISELWYDDERGFTEAKVIEGWLNLVRRYKRSPHVFMMDIKNEPHGRAAWGGNDPKTNWVEGAQRICNAILAENSKLLVMVEGVEKHLDINSWWGGTVAGVATTPIKLSVPDRLVYSVHTYGNDVYAAQPYFSDPTFPENMPAIWDRHFGVIAKGKLGCVVIGEWGGKYRPDTADRVWQNKFAEYLKANDYDWFYWCLNPESGDTGGLLQSDWKTPETQKLDLLKRCKPNPTVFDFSTSNSLPTLAPTPTLTPASVASLTAVVNSNVASSVTSSAKPTLTVAKTDSWKQGTVQFTKFELHLVNDTASILSNSETKMTISAANKIENSWSCTVSRRGSATFLTFPSWIKSLAPKESWTFGVIISGTEKHMPTFSR